MLKLLKIAMAQMEVVPGHPDVNTATILRFIEEARAKGADVVIFPEMAVPGYFLGDTWEQSAFLRDCESYGRDIIAASKDITVMFGNVAIDWQKKNNDGRVRKYNAFFIARDGELIQPDNMPYPYTIKTLMPNYREFDDTRHFFSLQKLARELGTTPSKLLSPVTLKIRDDYYRVGCLLCEDGWSDDYEFAPFELLEEKEQLDFYVNISASPYTLGKNDKRNRVFGRQAREAGVPLFYVNCIGLQNNGKTVYTFDGSSTAYNESGHVVRTLPEYEEALTILPLMEPLLSAIGKDATLTGRTPLWRQIILVMTNSHTFTGYGFGMFWRDRQAVALLHTAFRSNSFMGTMTTGAHNVLLEYWLNVGLFGLASYFIALLASFRQMRKLERQNYIFCAAYMLWFMVMGWTERSMSTYEYQMVFLFLAMGVGSNKPRPVSRRRARLEKEAT